MTPNIATAHDSPAIVPIEGGTEMALIMRMSGETIGLPVRMVNEIIDPIPITRVPNAPAFAPGLINVRGAVVPLLDLRQRLRMPDAPLGASARIVVVVTTIEGVLTRLAFMADAVEEVIEIDMAKLEQVPDLGAPWPDIYVAGVLRHPIGLVVLMNCDALFKPDTTAFGNA